VGNNEIVTVANDKGQSEQAAERHVRAFELRKQGFTYREIGAALGVSGKTAHEDVQRVLAELAETRLASAAEYVDMELERLDTLTEEATRILLATHPLISGGDVLSGFTPDGVAIGLTDAGPKLAAIRELRAISESRRKLLGLDAQHPIIVEQPYALTESERLERLVRLLDTARARRSGQAVIDVTPEPGHVAE
jgi:hypothetical protein